LIDADDRRHRMIFTDITLTTPDFSLDDTGYRDLLIYTANTISVHDKNTNTTCNIKVNTSVNTKSLLDQHY